jgi:cytochrome c553
MTIPLCTPLGQAQSPASVPFATEEPNRGVQDEDLGFILSAALGLSLAMLCGPSWSEGSSPGTTHAARRIAVEVCSACHGPAGNSTSPTFPRLAGQHESYLAAQIHAFKHRTRRDPDAVDYMWGVAAAIDDSLIAPLAAYFSSQSASSGRATPRTLDPDGNRIFEAGDPSRDIPSCASCHGSNAEGQSTIPKLAGQHSAYIDRQIHFMQSAVRELTTPHPFVARLSSDEVMAIARFLQSK